MEPVNSSPLAYSFPDLAVAAEQRFGLQRQDVLWTANALYTSGFISYPRTECRYLPTSCQRDVVQVLVSIFGWSGRWATAVLLTDPRHPHPVFNNAKLTAHHGIVPTGNLAHLRELPSELQRQVMTLVAEHYVSMFLSETHRRSLSLA